MQKRLTCKHFQINKQENKVNGNVMNKASVQKKCIMINDEPTNFHSEELLE